jgi:hypothetical protein
MDFLVKFRADYSELEAGALRLKGISEQTAARLASLPAPKLPYTPSGDSGTTARQLGQQQAILQQRLLAAGESPRIAAASARQATLDRINPLAGGFANTDEFNKFKAAISTAAGQTTSAFNRLSGVTNATAEEAQRLRLALLEQVSKVGIGALDPTKAGGTAAPVVANVARSQSTADAKALEAENRKLISTIRTAGAKYNELENAIPLNLEQLTTRELQSVLNQLRGLSRVYGREQIEAGERAALNARVKKFADEEGISDVGEAEAALVLKEQAAALRDEVKATRAFVAALRENTNNLQGLSGELNGLRRRVRAISETSGINRVLADPEATDEMVQAAAARRRLNQTTATGAQSIVSAEQNYVDATLEAARLRRVASLRGRAEQLGRPDLIPDDVLGLGSQELGLVDANILAEKKEQQAIIAQATEIARAQGITLSSYAQAQALVQNQTLAAQQQQLAAQQAAARTALVQSRIIPLPAAQTQAQQAQQRATAALARQQQILQNQAFAAQAQAAAAGGGGNGRGRFSNFLLGPQGGRGSSDGLGDFFGSGLRTTLKYSLPSLALFGTGRFLASSIREAEELDRVFARLQAQIEATSGEAGGRATERFNRLREEILSISRDTGVAGDQLGLLALRIQGAFGQGAGDVGNGVQGSDRLAREQLRSAAELSRITGISADQIGNSLQAISLAFGSTFEQIGNVTLQLEGQLGVSSNEIIDFLGDIAPVLQEVGFEGTEGMTEFATVASVAAQRSGQSASSIAEKFGRILPVLDQNRAQLLELANIDPALQGDTQFFDNVSAGSTRDILFELLRVYNDLNGSSQSFITQLVGGKREAQALLSAFAGADRINELLGGAIDPNNDTLARQFGRIDETLSQTFAKLGERVRQVGVQLLESGLRDVLQDAAGILGTILSILERVTSLFGGLNNATGGYLVQTLAVAAAFKGIYATMQAISRARAVEAVIGGAGLGGTNSAAGVAGLYAPTGLQNLSRTQVLAGTAGLAAYSIGVSKINQELNARYTETLDSIANATTAEDEEFLNSVIDNRNTAFQDFSSRVISGITGDFGGLFGATKDDKAQAAANAGLAQISASQTEEVINTILGDSEAVKSLGTLDQRIVDQINEQIRANPQFVTDAIRNSATGSQTVNTGNNPLNSGVGDAFNFTDDIAAFNVEDFANEDALIRLRDAAQDGDLLAAKILEMVTGRFANFAEFMPQEVQRALDAERAAQAAEDKTAQSLVSLEGLTAQYEGGGASATQLLEAIRENINLQERALQNQQNQGLNTTETLQRILELRQQQEQIFDNILAGESARQDIREVRGGDTQAALQTQLDRLDNIVKEQGDDLSKGQLLEVGMQQLDLRKQIFENAIENADNAEEALAIAQAGFEIPDYIRENVIRGQLDQNNQAWNQFLVAARLLYKDLTDSQIEDLAIALTMSESSQRATLTDLDAQIAKIEGQLANNPYANYGGGANKALAALRGARDAVANSLTGGIAEDPGATGGSTTEDLTNLAEKAADDAKKRADDAKKAQDELLKARANYAKALAAGDPVREALAAQAEADAAYNAATTEAERLDAMAQRVAADRSLEQAQDDITAARVNLLQAQYNAAGDEVGAAEVALEEAKRQRDRINALFAYGSGKGEVDRINAEAGVVEAEARARDARFRDQLDDYAFLFEMGDITRAQYVNLLTAYRSQIIASGESTEDQIREIDRAIKGLKDQAGSELQFNLPSSIQLPVLYEARRIGQAGSVQAGYVDNRNIQVVMYVTNGMTQQQAAEFLSGTLGNNRNGYQTKVY